MTIENTNAGGIADTNPVDQVKEDKVAYETYKKTLNEAKSAKEKNKELLTRLEQLETSNNELLKKQRSVEEMKLSEQGEFKKLLELREQELKETKQKLTVESEAKADAAKNLEDYYKLQAFYNKLPGKLLSDKYLKLIDLDEIVINPGTGEIDEASISTYAAKFVKEHPNLLDTSYSRRMPGDAPGTSSMSISKEQYKNMSLNDMKKNLPSLVRAERAKLGV